MGLEDWPSPELNFSYPWIGSAENEKAECLPSPQIAILLYPGKSSLG